MPVKIGNQYSIARLQVWSALNRISLGNISILSVFQLLITSD
jgi:hypothetical protein